MYYSSFSRSTGRRCMRVTWGASSISTGPTSTCSLCRSIQLDRSDGMCTRCRGLSFTRRLTWITIVWSGRFSGCKTAVRFVARSVQKKLHCHWSYRRLFVVARNPHIDVITVLNAVFALVFVVLFLALGCCVCMGQLNEGTRVAFAFATSRQTRLFPLPFRATHFLGRSVVSSLVKIRRHSRHWIRRAINCKFDPRQHFSWAGRLCTFHATSFPLASFVSQHALLCGFGRRCTLLLQRQKLSPVLPPAISSGTRSLCQELGHLFFENNSLEQKISNVFRVAGLQSRKFRFATMRVDRNQDAFHLFARLRK